MGTLNLHHIRHAVLQPTTYNGLSAAMQDVLNNRAGEVVDFWHEYGQSGGSGFLFQSVDLHVTSLFVVYEGAVWELALYPEWPVT